MPGNLSAAAGPIPAAEIVADLPVAIGVFPYESAVSRLSNRVSGNSFGTQESSRAFGDGAAYSSVFRVKFQRDGLVVVKSAPGMDADAFVILFTVGNESGKSASGFLRSSYMIVSFGFR